MKTHDIMINSFALYYNEFHLLQQRQQQRKKIFLVMNEPQQQSHNK